jgi:hypothetical protein
MQLTIMQHLLILKTISIQHETAATAFSRVNFHSRISTFVKSLFLHPNYPIVFFDIKEYQSIIFLYKEYSLCILI